MTLLDEIREHFATNVVGAWELERLPHIYPGWTVRFDDEYGVAIPYSNEFKVSEHFANVKLQSRQVAIDGKSKDLLYLSCSEDDLKYEFASLCAEFLAPGDNGDNRKDLLKSPTEWWKKWRSLLGNAMTEKQVYAVIGEMLVYEYLLGKDVKAHWAGPDAGSHDIESDEEAYEVKSTIKKYEASVTISGQHQLKSEKPLSLYFCRLEQSKQGSSINDMVKRLVAYGVNLKEIEKKLDKLGLEQGRSVRNEKYRLLEGRVYSIDDDFPRITNESFKEDKIPDKIQHIEYTVDLDGINYKNW